MNKPNTPVTSKKDQGKKLFDPDLQLPHGEHAGKKNDAGQKQHGQTEAVGGVEIGDPQGRNPVESFPQTAIRPWVVVGKEQINGYQQGDPGKYGADPFDLSFRSSGINRMIKSPPTQLSRMVER